MSAMYRRLKLSLDKTVISNVVCLQQGYSSRSYVVPDELSTRSTTFRVFCISAATKIHSDRYPFGALDTLHCNSPKKIGALETILVSGHTSNNASLSFPIFFARVRLLSCSVFGRIRYGGAYGPAPTPCFQASNDLNSCPPLACGCGLG